jgi:hypothetical protein
VFRAARDKGELFGLRALLALDERQFPPLARAAAFYAESHAFVQFLLSRGGRAKLLAAVRRFDGRDAVSVLSEAYGWASYGQMETDWLAFVRAR